MRLREVRSDPCDDLDAERIFSCIVSFAKRSPSPANPLRREIDPAFMMQHDCQTYPPLNTLKPVTDDVWIVDGPLIAFGPPLLRLQFPTRMTIIRLGRQLFVHSPTILTPELKAEVDAIGVPGWIIGPNRLH